MRASTAGAHRLVEVLAALDVDPVAAERGEGVDRAVVAAAVDAPGERGQRLAGDVDDGAAGHGALGGARGVEQDRDGEVARAGAARPPHPVRAVARRRGGRCAPAPRRRGRGPRRRPAAAAPRAGGGAPRSGGGRRGCGARRRGRALAGGRARRRWRARGSDRAARRRPCGPIRDRDGCPPAARGRRRRARGRDGASAGSPGPGRSGRGRSRPGRRRPCGRCRGRRRRRGG